MSTQQPEAFLGDHQIQAVTYKQQAYTLIKDAILYRRLKTELVYSQDGLCAELGISRTPVREALLELQQEGYINIMRGKGIQIVPLTRKQAADIIEMRNIIEFAGAELAAQRATDRQIAYLQQLLLEMENGFSSQDAVFMYKLDRKFHRAIFEAADNRHLLDSVENLRDQFLRVETLDAFDSTEKYEQVVREHREIYQGIAEHDAKRACDAIRQHLSCTYCRTIQPVLDLLK